MNPDLWPPNDPLRTIEITRFYKCWIDHIRRMAADHGYCIAVHGSLARDMDILAAPWAEDAKPADELVIDLSVMPRLPKSGDA